MCQNLPPLLDLATLSTGNNYGYTYSYSYFKWRARGSRCVCRLPLWTRGSASSVWGTLRPTWRQPHRPRVPRHRSRPSARRAARPAVRRSALGPRPPLPPALRPPSRDRPSFVVVVTPGFTDPGLSVRCYLLSLVLTSVDSANHSMFVCVYVLRPVRETSQYISPALLYAL